MNDAQRMIDKHATAAVMAALMQPPGTLREEMRQLAISLRRIEGQLGDIRTATLPQVILAYSIED